MGVAHSAAKMTVCEALVRRQSSNGGWGYFHPAQPSIEVTCLVALALGGTEGLSTSAQETAVTSLLRWQNVDGSWPAFPGDTEGSWVTSLALTVLNTLGDGSGASDRASRWILEIRGREGYWPWRWKFKVADRNVGFDPDKFGWPWTPGTTSWVIPTAFSLVAIKQFTACRRSELSERRIRTGVEMLLDRACIGGGWNAGNSVVYGVPLEPHVEPTAIAMLALQDEPRSAVVQQSLYWLRRRAAKLQSISSLATAILVLFLYQDRIQELQERLSALVRDGVHIQNNATLAMAALALKCGETVHPFAVIR
jgi:hypothetical protein